MTKVETSNLERTIGVEVLGPAPGSGSLEITLSELRAGSSINGHENSLIAPANIDTVFVLIIHILVQLSPPHVTAEAEEEGQLATPQLQREEVTLQHGEHGR